MNERSKKRLVTANVVLWVMQALYTASPIDLIPDLSPILGWADDGLGFVAVTLFTIWTVVLLRKHGRTALAKVQQTLGDLVGLTRAFGPTALDIERADLA